MRQWRIEFRDEMEDVLVEADSMCCEGGVAFFYVPAEPWAGSGPRNRTIAAVPLDVVLTIREAG